MLHLAPTAILLAGSLGVISVSAQAPPPFQGELLLQPSATHDKCLAAASNANGAAVALQNCDGSPSQKWTFSGGSVRVFGDKCLDVVGGNTADGAQLQIWTCQDGNSNQQWDYSKWTNSITWWQHNKCLDLAGGSTSVGAKAHMWTCFYGNSNQVWNVGYLPNQLPDKSQEGQYGTNRCGTSSHQESNCQTAWINSAEDFCLWAPPHANSTIGDTEHEAVAWCTKSGRGTRSIPDKTFSGVHFVKTPDYVQVTGRGDFTKLNLRANDDGGELDNRGATGVGNPSGGLVFGNTFGPNTQYHEWTSFLSHDMFCIRACIGAKATKLCNHIYDEMGCEWNIPADYSKDKYENCDGDDAEPMGVYGTSTWSQHTSPTPAAHPAPASSNCVAVPSITASPAQQARRRMERRSFHALPRATPISGARAHRH